MPQRERLRTISQAVVSAGGGSTFVSPSQPKNKIAGSTDSSTHPPMGQVHTKRADGTWEVNQIRSAWDERPGPTFNQLQQKMAPLGSSEWPALEVHASELASLFDACSDPLRAVGDGTVPAVIVRGALSPEYCASTVQMFIDRGLMRDDKSKPATTDGFDVTTDKPAGYGNGTVSLSSAFVKASGRH